MTLVESAASTRGAFGLIEQTLPVGFAPPSHLHKTEDEAFFIISGTFEFVCDGQPLSAGPGSWVWIPKGRVHRFTVTGGEAPRLLQFNFPAGVEAFFVELGTPVNAGPPPSGPPDVARLIEVGARYGIEFVNG